MSPVLAEQIAAEIGDVVDPGRSMRSVPGPDRDQSRDWGPDSMTEGNVTYLRGSSASLESKPGQIEHPKTVAPADQAITRRPRDILLEAGIPEVQAEAFLNAFSRLRSNSIAPNDAEKSLTAAGFKPEVANELVFQILTS